MLYKTTGTCSQLIDLEVNEDGILTKCHFTGGCQGNLQGISKLVVGMPAREVINKLEGITCGMKRTSCPDQLAQALKSLIQS